MSLKQQSKLKTKSAKRIGRGPGSGRGKTSGRGTKGQNARGRLSIGHSHYEGGQRPLFKRLPYRRGKGNSKISKKPIIVNVKAINLINKSETVNLQTLIKYKIVEEVSAKVYGVKILGDGEVQNPYTIIDLSVSKSAAQKIEKAGGKIINTKKTANLIIKERGTLKGKP